MCQYNEKFCEELHKRLDDTLQNMNGRINANTTKIHELEQKCVTYEDQISALRHEINESKEVRKEFGGRLSHLELSKGRMEKDLEKIFEYMEDMKTNISEIAKSLKHFETKGTKTLEQLGYEAIKYIMIAVLGFIAAKLI